MCVGPIIGADQRKSTLSYGVQLPQKLGHHLGCRRGVGQTLQRLLAASFIFVHAAGVFVPALGGEVMARLGASPMQLPGGTIYQTLEKGTLMPSSGLGSMMIEKLGFL